VLEGILWVLNTGARWRHLPPQYPSPATCWRRLRDWEEQDVWLKVWRTFIEELDETGHLE
jgi:transposase